MSDTGTSQVKDLPQASVKLQGKDGFKIELEKLEVNDYNDQSDLVLDQKGQGCITSPGGPGC